jgi:hypothetical protein
MFDPYHKWLGIPPKDQPPNYYRLLAIDPFESDTEVIDAAANRQMAYVQQRATGEHIKESQQLLNELAAARLCLLDQKKKAQYDLQLKINLRQQARKAGKTQAKPADSAQPFSLKARGSLIDYESTPPLAGKANSPPNSKQSPQAGPFSRIPRWTWFIILALGGGIILVTVLIIAMRVLPGWENKPDAVASGSDSEGGGGSANGANDENENHIRKPPKAPTRIVYDVEIDPPEATLIVKNNLGTITGSGRSRQIHFDDIPWRSYVVITATCEGYQPYTRSFAPRPGQHEKLLIELHKETATPITPAEPLKNPIVNSAGSTPNVAGAVASSGANNPLTTITKATDAKGESLQGSGAKPKTERCKVYVFNGQSAIVTPVSRLLPSTVEAWIFSSKPAENAEMYVFGSDDAKLSTGGLGLFIGKDGKLWGRRSHKNKDQRDFWTNVFLPLQKWIHLAVTFDEDKICFFADGHRIASDKGAQEMGPARFVIGYICLGKGVNLKYTFVGWIRTLRISSGIRYTAAFQPPLVFNKDQDKEGFKTLLIYEASNGKTNPIPDTSGNKKDGTGLNIQIGEENVPVPGF